MQRRAEADLVHDLAILLRHRSDSFCLEVWQEVELFFWERWLRPHLQLLAHLTVPGWKGVEVRRGREGDDIKTSLGRAMRQKTLSGKKESWELV
jgi:hypothetical protein